MSWLLGLFVALHLLLLCLWSLFLYLILIVVYLIHHVSVSVKFMYFLLSAHLQLVNLFKMNAQENIFVCWVNLNCLVLSCFFCISPSQHVPIYVFLLWTQGSSSSDSLDGPGLDFSKSYDAVVFDVLKVTPEEFAVSTAKDTQKTCLDGDVISLYCLI